MKNLCCRCHLHSSKSIHHTQVLTLCRNKAATERGSLLSQMRGILNQSIRRLMTLEKLSWTQISMKLRLGTASGQCVGSKMSMKLSRMHWTMYRRVLLKVLRTMMMRFTWMISKFRLGTASGLMNRMLMLLSKKTPMMLLWRLLKVSRRKSKTTLMITNLMCSNLKFQSELRTIPYWAGETARPIIWMILSIQT